jgi:hypothetical protein
MQKTPAGAILPKPTETTYRDASQFARITRAMKVPANRANRFTPGEDTGPPTALHLMYGSPYMRTAVVEESGGQVSVVLRGFSTDDLRRQALGECGRVFGDCPWQLTRAEVVPCMVSAGGRVRLYEGHFSACRKTEPAASDKAPD